MHYNPKQDTIVASDFRAVIFHKENNNQVKAIAHASRALLLAEKG